MIAIKYWARLSFMFFASLVMIVSCVRPQLNTKLPKETLVTTSQVSTQIITQQLDDASELLSTKCPSLVDITNLDVTGSLIRGTGGLTAIHLPDLGERSPVIYKEGFSFYEAVASGNGLFIATEAETDDGKMSTIDVFSTTGHLIASIPRQNDWTGIWGWSGDSSEIVMFSEKENALITINPFANSVHEIVLPLANIEIVSYSPRVDKLVYSSISSGGHQYLTIWNVNTQTPIWSDDKLFMPQVSDIAWSSSGNMVAVTSYSSDEHAISGKMNMEIIVVDEFGNHYQLSDFRNLFPEIQIVDLQWSKDDKRIFFWAQTQEKNKLTESNYDLYDIEIETKKITQYCYTGESHGNKLIWIDEHPNYFIVSNITKYDLYNADFSWDVLLVDYLANRFALIGTDFFPKGWITDQ